MATRVAYTLTPLLTGLILEGCAVEYGAAVGQFGQFSVHSNTAYMDYYIIGWADFQLSFPDNPVSLSSSDDRVQRLLKSRSVWHTNDGNHPYRDGIYYISYRCNDVIRFSAIRIDHESSPQTFEIGCES